MRFWYSKTVVRFLKDNGKNIYRNIKPGTLKVEKNKSDLMLNETCYTNSGLLLAAKRHELVP